MRKFLEGADFLAAHNALSDAEACAKIVLAAGRKHGRLFKTVSTLRSSLIK